jgi:hypothetical protein
LILEKSWGPSSRQPAQRRAPFTRLLFFIISYVNSAQQLFLVRHIVLLKWAKYNCVGPTDTEAIVPVGPLNNQPCAPYNKLGPSAHRLKSDDKYTSAPARLQLHAHTSSSSTKAGFGNARTGLADRTLLPSRRSPRTRRLRGFDRSVHRNLSLSSRIHGRCSGRLQRPACPIV